MNALLILLLTVSFIATSAITLSVCLFMSFNRFRKKVVNLISNQTDAIHSQTDVISQHTDLIRQNAESICKLACACNANSDAIAKLAAIATQSDSNV